MAGLSVRAARVEDAARVGEINLISWAAYREIADDAILDGLSLADRVAGWQERISAGASLLVAEDNGTVVGYCLHEAPAREADLDPDTGTIRALYVDPGHFRNGVGTLLMEAALARLRDGGCTQVVLRVLVGNARAAAFYARHGFAPDGSRRPSRLGADEVRMRRAL